MRKRQKTTSNMEILFFKVSDDRADTMRNGVSDLRNFDEK